MFRCFALLFAFFVNTASSDELVLSVANFSNPPHYVVENGEFAGFSREMWDQFSADTGHTVVYKMYGIKKMFSELMLGNVHIKYPDTPEWHEPEHYTRKIIYSDPVLPYIQGVLVLNANKGKPVSVLRRLGAINGMRMMGYEQLIEEGGVEVVRVDDLPALVELSLSGEVDGIYGNVDHIAYEILNNINLLSANQLVFDRTLPYKKSYYRAGGDEKFVQYFNEWLAENRTFIEELRVKYDYGQLLDLAD